MEMIKVLYIIPYPEFFSQISNIGGHVAHVVGVVKGLKEIGCQVTVITAESYYLIEEIADNVVVVPCDASSILGRFRWNFRFVKAARKFQTSIDYAYMRYSVGFAPFISGIRKSVGECALMLEVNSFLSQRKPFVGFIEGKYVRQADYVLTVSERNHKDIRKYLGKAISEKTIVVTNGVDLNRFSGWSTANSRCWSHPVVLGYAGLIKNGYGLETIIEGFKILRSLGLNVSMRIFGDGPYKNVLESNYADLEGLCFCGPQPFSEMPKILESIDILVNSATYKNAFQSPTKMFEYMASGRPIVSARTPQCECLLKRGELGALFEMDDPVSFASAVQEIVAKPDEALVKAKAARHEAEKNHSWVSKCKSILEVLKGNQCDE
mgnify:CR=1 FL=1